jgi:hypothetical protein
MKLIASSAALVFVCGTALADVPGYHGSLTLRSDPIGGYTARTASVYDSMPGPYSAFGRAAGQAALDDYGTSVTDPSMLLAQFKFVGGVNTAGQALQVNFYDTTNTLTNFFTVNLPSGGDFLWTITLGAQPDGSDSTFAVPNNGFAEIVIDPAATGRWFFTATAPSVGTNDVTVGTGGQLNPQRYNAFGLVVVPAPASLALLGVGGLLASRRRR